MNREEASLHDYLKILKKRRWTMLSVFLGVFLSVAAATFLSTPIYRATAQLYIDPGSSQQYTFQQAQAIDTNSYIQTQIGILKSESIAYEVVTSLGLDKTNHSGSGIISTIKSALGMESANPENITAAAMADFESNLKVEAVKNSNLVKVSYDDKDPQLAAAVVNRLIEKFINQNLEMKVEPARKAMAWLNDKLGEMKSKMTTSASDLESFKQSKNLISDDHRSNISIESLSDLNSKSLSAEADRYQSEAKWEQVQKLSKIPDGLMSLPEVINNNLIQNLKAQESDLNKQIAEQSQKFGEKHPQMMRLRGEKESLKRQIDQEVGLIVDSIKNSYNTSLNAEQRLKGALSRSKGEAMSYERRASEYELKKQDVQGSKDIYDVVLKKFQESNLMGNINMSNVQLLDRAQVPDVPVRPKKAMNLMFGIFMGLFCGVGFAFIFEFLDNTFKTPEEIEETLGLPFLGLVPTSKQLQHLKKQEDSAVFSNPKQSVSEAFRNIRTNLVLATGDVKPQVIQIVSAISSEGKTTVSVNLAGIMAASGEKVLLIDADMRRPRVHRVFKLQNTLGLSTLLTHQAQLPDVIRQTPIQNLSIITSGPISPSPGELLGSKAMVESLVMLRGMYDRIIIDCPPVMGIADASMLSPQTDGILMVIKSGKTSKELVLKAKKNLETINAKVRGVILNDVSRKLETSYYQYYHYYYSETPEK